MSYYEEPVGYRARFSVDAKYFFLDGEDDTIYNLEFFADSDCTYDGEVTEYDEFYSVAREILSNKGIDSNAVDIDIEKYYLCA